MIDKSRLKSKRILEGRLPAEDGPLVRVTFSCVKDENGSHLEVAGTAPAVNGATSTADDVKALAKFCDSVCDGESA